MHKFNVYDLRWRLVDTLYGASDDGLSVGDFRRDDESYTAPVYIKRMS